MKSRAAEFLAEAIELSGKKQIRIAEEAGFGKPNVITMFKTGRTPIPLARVPALAAALGVPAEVFLRICLEEYRPEVLKVLEDVYGI